MSQLDISLFRYLNSWAGWSKLLDMEIIFDAEYLLFVIIGTVLAFYFFDKNKLRAHMAILHAFSAGIFARFIIKPVIVFFWDRPRPFQVLDNAYQLIFRDGGGSMPSGHAAFSFAVAAAVYFYYPKTSAIFFLAALAMGAGRVAAGVHWPSDILAGAVVGIFSAWFIKLIFNKIKS